MRVDTSLLQGITAANQPTKASSTALKSTGTTTSFSSQLKSATDKETTKAVPGTNYAEILTGPAPAFTSTRAAARVTARPSCSSSTTTAARTTSTAPARTAPSSASAARSPGRPSKTDGEHSTSEKAPAGETTKQVEGRAFHDILTGSRKGLYLNTSGNARDGQAFVLVKRDGREYHIYGTGKDREIFSILDKSSKKTAPEPTETTPDTPSTTDTSNTGSTVPTSPLVTDNPS